MERLTFENAIGEKIEISRYGTYRWTDVSGLGSVEASVQTTSGPYQDGLVPAADSMFLSRVIQIGLVIVSENMAAAIRELNSVFNPKLGDGMLTYERAGAARMLKRVRARSMPTMPGGASRGIGFQLSSLTLEAFNPYYMDSVETESGVATGANTFSFPLGISDEFIFDYVNSAGVTVVNVGDVESPVTIVLDGPKNAPIEIENVTTGEKIVLAMDLLENERLTITTEADDINVVLTDTETGEDTVAFQYIDISETSFWQLARGSNTIKITAGEAEVEEASVKYRNRYVGV